MRIWFSVVILIWADGKGYEDFRQTCEMRGVRNLMGWRLNLDSKS